METNDVFRGLVIEPQFKSYYVVWKRQADGCRPASGKFKSYYVVWKPLLFPRFFFQFFGLNCTM